MLKPVSTPSSIAACGLARDRQADARFGSLASGAALANATLACCLDAGRRALRGLVLLALLALCAGLAACAAPKQREVFHGFTFNARNDGQNVEILGFRYGPKDDPIIYDPIPSSGYLKALQSTGSAGGYRVGDELYVKWRDKATDKIYEETFILKGKLPQNMTGATISFLVRENTLNVYVAFWLPPIPGQAYDGPSIFKPMRVTKLN